MDKGKDPYPENVAMNGYTNQFWMTLALCPSWYRTAYARSFIASVRIKNVVRANVYPLLYQ